MPCGTPPGLDDGPETSCENEAPGEERVDVSPSLQAPLRENDVERVRAGRSEGRRDAHAVEGAAVPDLDDEREAGQGQREREPQAAPDRFVDEEARPDGDQHGSEVLDDEGDPDVEMGDRREVEEVDEGEPGDAEEEEEPEVAPLDPQALRPHECDGREQDQACAGGTQLGEP
jgi:hypothetical protein